MKKITQCYFLLALGFICNTFAQSNCANAIEVFDGVTNSSTVVSGSASAEMAATNGNTAGTDAAWFYFTAFADGQISISSCNGGSDTRLYVGTGTCGALSVVANNDDSCDLGSGNNWASEVSEVPVTSGTIYYIEWDDHWEADVQFDWVLNFTPTPLCGIPEAITVEAISNNQIDFSWSASTFSVGSASGYNWGIYTDGDTPPSGAALAEGYSSALNLNASSGAVLSTSTNYDLYIQSDCGETGGFSEYVLFEFSTTNDCSTAIEVFDGVTNSNTVVSGSDSAEMAATNGDIAGTDAAWFYYTPTEDGWISISSCNGGSDTRLYVGTGTCGALNVVANNDDFCDLGNGNNWASEVEEVFVTSGTIYYIEWDDRWDEDVQFDWILNFTPLPLCGVPEAITIEAIYDDQVDFSWSAPTYSAGIASGYNWGIYTDGDLPSSSSPVIEGSGPALDASSGTTLSANTDYDLYIQSDCGENNGFSEYVLFEFTTAPSCGIPEAIIIDAIYLDQIDFSWSAPTLTGGSASGYNWGIYADGESPTSSGPLVEGSGTTLSASSGATLSPDTAYDLYIQSDCGETYGFSEYVLFEFTTLNNDNFTNAIALNCGDTVTGSTTTATLDEGDAPDVGSADVDAPNVWYSYTGSGTAEEVTIDLCQSAYDTSVLIYTGSSGNLTGVAGNDDNSACAQDFRSLVTFPSDGITTYFIAVEGYNFDNVGDFSLSISCLDLTPPPVNDDCASAIMLTSGIEVSGTTVGATQDPTNEQPSCDIFENIADVWYSFDNQVNGASISIMTTFTGTSDEAYLALYSTCSGLQADQLACSASNNNNTGELLEVSNLDIGTYYIRVWSDGNAPPTADRTEGTFNIVINETLSTTSLDKEPTLTYYPNPVSHTLSLSARNSIESVKVYNSLGQEMFIGLPNTRDAQVDMSKLANGLYFIKVSVNGNVQTLSVIKS